MIKIFNGISIRYKIWLVQIPLILILLVTSVLFYVKSNSLFFDIKTTIHDQGLESLDLILNADRDLYQALNAIQALDNVKKTDEKYQKLVADYKDNMNQVDERVNKAANVLKENEGKWKNYLHPDSKRNLFDDFLKFSTEINKWKEKSDAMIVSGDINKIYNSGYLDEFDQAREYLNGIGELVKTAIDEEMKHEKIESDKDIMNIIVLIGIGFLISILLSLLFINGIIRTLKEAAKVLLEIRKGHLGFRMKKNIKNKIKNSKIDKT